MLRESELTLQKALDLCQAVEATKDQMTSMAGSSTAVDIVKGQFHKKFGKCGGTHPRKSCHAFGNCAVGVIR